MSLNRVVLIGRMTADPEIRTTSSGVQVANFSLAVDRRFKNAQGERETDFVNIVAWRKTAELVGQYCHKGRRLAVDGSLQVRTYQAQDGSNRRAYEVVADNVQFLDSSSKQGGTGYSEPPPPDTAPPPTPDMDGGENDDLPF